MSEDSLKNSYTAADTFPAKLLKTKDVPDHSGRIPPIHLQLNPTNLCNLDCAFCSCSARDKTLEWDFELAKETILEAKHSGCRAVTITGGGEPLLYSKINELILFLFNLNISVGLVTNGTQFSKIDPVVLNTIVWVRISHSDDRLFDPSLLGGVVLKAPAVDWAFSYVLSAEPNAETLCDVINYANANKFTHVRIVSDLLRLREIHDMGSVQIYLRAQDISDRLVIYQGRKEFVHGREKCLISLLKPVIGADGMIYPCCGTQYAMDPPAKDYDPRMSMGPAIDIRELYLTQKYFEGNRCKRCYYDSYNEALKDMITPVTHMDFL